MSTKQVQPTAEQLMNEWNELVAEKRLLVKQYKRGSRVAADRIIEIDHRLNEIDKLTSIVEKPSQEEIDSHE